MKKNSTLFKWGVTLCLLSSTTFLHSNPSDPTIISGDVSFSNPQANTLQVSSESSRSIVEWETFSISSIETTNFVLPSSSSAILNRVTSTGGEYASDISGTLTSNGQVYLINSNGILIGNGAVVNTAGFLASTLDADDQEFLNMGDMTFTGDDNSDVFLVNTGTITADDGDIILLSYQIQNTGETNAPEGTVAQGAGVEIVLQPNSSDDRIVIVPSSARARAKQHLPAIKQVVDFGVDDSSTIEALKVEFAADGNLYAQAIRHEGTIEVTGIPGHNSQAKFTGVDGETFANGSITALDNGNIGGEINILGTEVNLGNSAALEASGNSGGGIVNIGGGWGGEDPDLMNSTTLTFASTATINADANTNGNGGTVVVWANHTATFAGAINARGGQTSGDGGAVEVSGLNTTNFTGTVDIDARGFGENGSLTMDPKILNFRCRKGKIPAEITLITPTYHRHHCHNHQS